MATLGNASNTASIIQKYNFTFQKRYGQNFLIDEHVLDKIISAADVSKQDCVIEIGPGIGTMTQYLCENAGKVIAIEIDKELIPILKDTLSQYDNVTVIHGDVMKIDLQELIEKECKGYDVKFVANLPYYITTPIIMGLLEKRLNIKSITVMVQKEVAERMQCGPGTKDYGALSLAVQYYADAYIAANVPPNCFMPRPKVGSAVIRLSVHTQSPVEVIDDAQMFKLVRGAFNQRRKTLVNAVANFDGLDFSKEEIADALKLAGMSETVRGEALSLNDFAKLSNVLSERKNR